MSRKQIQICVNKNISEDVLSNYQMTLIIPPYSIQNTRSKMSAKRGGITSACVLSLMNII